VISSSDAVAFEEFVRAFSDRLVRSAYMLTGDLAEAEDMAQTALMRTARHWRKARRLPYAYARATVVNLARDRWRRLARRPEEYATDVEQLGATADLTSGARGVGGAAGGHDEFDLVLERDAIMQAIHGLAPQQRAVVVLRYLEDMSVQETADVLGCAPGTVKAHTSRALDRLQEVMQAVTTKRPGT
jgi:RNA polymerase sigma factor (sigma-70 family)